MRKIFECYISIRVKELIFNKNMFQEFGLDVVELNRGCRKRRLRDHTEEWAAAFCAIQPACQAWRVWQNPCSDTIAVDVYRLRDGVCDYGGHCLSLANLIRNTIPNSVVCCKTGRQGSFEITINEKKVYSKLQTMALPDFEEVVEVVSEVSKGAQPRQIKGQQPVNCAVS